MIIMNILTWSDLIQQEEESEEEEEEEEEDSEDEQEKARELAKMKRG